MRELGKRGQEGISVGGALGGILLVVAVVAILLIGLGFVTGHGWQFWEMFTGGTVNIGARTEACLTQCNTVAPVSESQAKNVYCDNRKSDLVYLNSKGEKIEKEGVSCFDIVEMQISGEIPDLGFDLTDEFKDCAELHALCGGGAEEVEDEEVEEEKCDSGYRCDSCGDPADLLETLPSGKVCCIKSTC